VKINYDPKKNEKNIRERGLSFDRAVDLDFATASYFLRESAEVRRIVVGYLDKRLHVLVYQYRDGGLWVISFRKASTKEAKRYGKAKTTD
jgi:uncharacterized DUF497 family protein